MAIFNEDVEWVHVGDVRFMTSPDMVPVPTPLSEGIGEYHFHVIAMTIIVPFMGKIELVLILQV